MTRFSGHLTLRMAPGADGTAWHLAEPMSYASQPQGPGQGAVFTLRPGLRTDGASIPRAFWRVLGCPLRDRHAPAAVLHDALYATELLPRDRADALFLEALQDIGVPAWRSRTLWAGVRAGGAMVWSGHIPEQVRSAREYLEVRL